MIHVEMLKQQADVVARLFQEFDKPVLDFDVVICFGQAKAGCAFKRPLTDWVQLADKTLQIETCHKNGSIFGVRQ